MSIWTPTQRDQKSAVDEYNEYCNAKQDLEAEFQLRVSNLMGDDDLTAEELAEAMNELENSDKFFRHAQTMRRLIQQMREEDIRATNKVLANNTAIEIDPYWSTVVDHTNRLNPNYEPTKRMVFDMSARMERSVDRGPSQSIIGRRRSSTVKFTSNPLAKSE